GLISLESFASPMNSTCPRYCSLFKDIEEVFGSYGSFFQLFHDRIELEELLDTIPNDAIIQMNPPYIGSITYACVQKCNQVFKWIGNKKRISFILFTPPDWNDITELLLES